MSEDGGPSTAERTAELSANLTAVRKRIAAACDMAGRSESEITLIAVTKTFPASDVRLLAGLGVTDVAENRDQEAAPKAADCADLPLIWHFVGQLQTNKARSVVKYADIVHSVDRMRLVTALSVAAVRAERTLRCLIQVCLDPVATATARMAGRGGVAPAGVPALADAVAAAEGLELAGVMGVAPLGAEPRQAFTLLRQTAHAVQADHPDALIISAGMSMDLEQAIACGATHVRIGTALLGGRQAIVR